jgi:hypothetical protein
VYSLIFVIFVYFRLEPSKGTYAKEWAHWESRLRKVMTDNADYVNSIQVLLWLPLLGVEMTSACFISNCISIVNFETLFMCYYLDLLGTI